MGRGGKADLTFLVLFLDGLALWKRYPSRMARLGGTIVAPA